MAYHRSEQAIGRVAEAAARMYPDAFVGSRLSMDPFGAPRLLIKGKADAKLSEMVAAESVRIVVADGQPYSFDELEARKSVVHAELQAAGFQDLVTGYRLAEGGLIRAVVGGSASNRQAMVATAILDLPAPLRDDVVVRFADTAVVQPEGAFGGMQIKDDNVDECTSGWTVRRNSDGARGISAAAHCSGVNEVEHTGHGDHAMSYQAGHEGAWGDVEWHSTGQAEADDFYANATTVRDVTAVEAAANIAENEVICIYGRATNVQRCSAEVLEVSINCGALGRIVQMNADVSTGGDSGGPWFYTTRAYGGHFGTCDGLSSFTKAAYFDEALGVSVPTT